MMDLPIDFWLDLFAFNVTILVGIYTIKALWDEYL